MDICKITVRELEKANSNTNNELIEINFIHPRNGRPIWFNADPASRMELNKERSLEELMDFVEDYKLDHGLTTAMHNNEIGYKGFFEVEGTLVLKEGELFLQPGRALMSDDHECNEEIMKEVFPQNDDLGLLSMGEMNDSLSDLYQSYNTFKDSYRFFLVMQSDRLIVYAIYDDENDRKASDEYCMNILHEGFVQFSQVKTYRNLCRLINKGEKLRAEYNEVFSEFY